MEGGVTVTAATASYLDNLITRALTNTENFTGRNAGEFFEKVAGAASTDFEAIDDIIDEGNGKKSIVSLGSKSSRPDWSDNTYIEKVEKELRSKGKRINNNRTIPPRNGRNPEQTLQSSTIKNRVMVVALPEERLHLATDPRMRRMLLRLQGQLRNVKMVVAPLRNWRSR